MKSTSEPEASEEWEVSEAERRASESSFGDANSWLGGDDDDDLPLVTGTEDDPCDGPPKSVMVLVCGECDCRYGLPDEIDDVKLLEMCPRCANLFDSRGRFAIPATGERARAAMNQIE